MLLIRALVLCLGFLSIAVSANAQTTRLALVIGNSNYSALPLLPPLPNPTIEAGRVATGLRNTGFAVTLVTNGTSAQMRQALETFSQQANALPQGSIALVYFAGHGLSYRNMNYIIPVGTRELSVDNIRTEAISLEELAAYVPANMNTASVIVIDACRDVPEGARDPRLTYGFTRVSPPLNAMFAFSTPEGRTAAEGLQGVGSPFANAFVSMLVQLPGAEVEFFFRQVRRRVVIATESGQVPVEYNGLLNAISLNGNALSTRDRRTAAARDLIDNGDQAEGVALAERSAREGDVNAMRLVSDAYRMGNGVRRDVNVALDWARRAAAVGNDNDKAYWADFVMTTTGQPSARVAEARETLAQLVAANNTDAISLYARQLQVRGGPVRARTENADWARAAELWERSALLGSGAAAVNVGVLHQMGAGVPHNLDRARHWYLQAAAAGIPRGRSRLGVVLTSFGTRTRRPAEDEEAIGWFRRAAAAGDLEAKYWLGLLTYMGIGTPRDVRSAIDWMRQAVGNGVQPDTGVNAAAPNFLRAMEAGWEFREPLLDSTRTRALDPGGFIAPR